MACMLSVIAGQAVAIRLNGKSNQALVSLGKLKRGRVMIPMSHPQDTSNLR